MSSFPSISHGTISERPFNHAAHGEAHSHGTLRGNTERTHGTLRGDIERMHGTLGSGGHAHGRLIGTNPASMLSSAVAELGSLISSLSSLSTQAQSFPPNPPSVPAASQNQTYQPQTTDYTQFVDGSN